MPRAERVKRELRAFYAAEAAERNTEAWIRAGASPRVPESRSAWYFIDRKVTAAVAMTGLRRDSRVLEVGCSFGHMTFLLAERFREVVAVDLSPESVELARRRAAQHGIRNVEFQIADAEDLAPFTDESFDGAFSFSTLRFCPRPARALAELHRTLRRGGAAAVDVPNRDCPWYGPLKRLVGLPPHIHDRLFSAAEITREMQQAGFGEVRVRPLLFTPKRAPDVLLPLCKGLDRVLERTPGVRFWSGILMASGRKHGDR